MSKKGIDIIYVVYFNHKELLNSLKSLKDFFYDSDYTLNIVIWDNSKNSNLYNKFLGIYQEFISEYININFILSTKNFGFGGGCNKAFEHTVYDLIMILNHHTSFAISSIVSFKKMISFCTNKSPIVGPKILTENGLIH